MILSTFWHLLHQLSLQGQIGVTIGTGFSYHNHRQQKVSLQSNLNKKRTSACRLTRLKRSNACLIIWGTKYDDKSTRF